MIDNKQNYGIFSETTFFNEGIGTALFASYVLGLGLMVLTFSISEKIKSHKEMKYIRESFKKICETDKDVDKFDQSIHKVRSISLKEFNERIGKNIDIKDRYRIGSSNISIIVMEDIDNNILAYCLFDEERANAKYIGYKILGNYSKSVQTYIAAIFEYKLGFYGKNIKSIVKDLNRDFRVTDQLKRIKNSTDISILSNEEKQKLKKDIDELRNKLLSFIKSKISSYDIKTEDECILIYDPKWMKILNSYNDDFEKADDNASKYFKAGDYEKFCTKVKDTLDEFAKINKLSSYGDGAKGTSTSYPYTKITVYEQPDDYCEIQIYVDDVFGTRY